MVLASRFCTVSVLKVILALEEDWATARYKLEKQNPTRENELANVTRQQINREMFGRLMGFVGRNYLGEEEIDIFRGES